MKASLFEFSLVCSAVLAVAHSSRAQCAAWDDRFHLPGADGAVEALAVFDDGTGPALYAGGAFATVHEARASGIARWDGARWSPVREGVVSSSLSELPFVHELCEFDDGSGPALFVGGRFASAGGVSARNVAKWNGSNWSALGVGSSIPVEALAVFDDGSGLALYASGSFPDATGTTTPGIGKWNGTQWTVLPDTGSIFTLAVYDDGAGPALYLGGRLADAQGEFAVGRWNGASVSRIGDGIRHTIASTPPPTAYDLEVFDPGTGPVLYAAGEFQSDYGAPGNCIAQWSGSTWSAVGTASIDGLRALLVFDDGAGPALWAGGSFQANGPIPEHGLSKWTGSAWSPATRVAMRSVSALTCFDDGSGPAIFAAGSFEESGDLRATRIAKWDGTTRLSLGEGLGLSMRVQSLTSFDDGSGASLIAAGDLVDAGGRRVDGLARRTSSGWEPFPHGVPPSIFLPEYRYVQAVATFDDGAGSRLYVGGTFSSVDGTIVRNIAAWDGANWSDVGGGAASTYMSSVRSFYAFDDGSGPALFAGGEFTSMGSGPASAIAKWDGASWSALGTGLRPVPGGSATARAMAAFDDGTGSALYVGGWFIRAGPAIAINIAKWDGAHWSALGGGIGPAFGGDASIVLALAVFDDGTGPALFAGGSFHLAGGATAINIAKWDGATWSPVGGGLSGPIGSSVRALAVFDDGTGPALYAAGAFAYASNIARWNGTSWSTVDGGVVSRVPSWQAGVDALLVFDDGADGVPELCVGGEFALAGGKPSSNFAEWRGCAPGIVHCTGDGLDPTLAVACPCGNVGEPGRGCANSNALLGGARLTASGSKFANTVELAGEGIPNGNLSAFLVASGANAAGIVFGDGIQCLTGSTSTFAQQISGGGTNAPHSVRSHVSRGPAGSTRFYQVLYRNPSAGFCATTPFNVSNSYRIDW